MSASAAAPVTYIQEGAPVTYIQEGAPVTYIQEGMPGMPVTYVTQEGMPGMPMPMMYAAPQPLVYNISPEIFARIAQGGAMTQDEINELMGAPAPQPVMPMGTTLAAPSMAAAPVPATTTAKSSSKDKSS